jgi:DNA-binding Lrp family transcriptional regulator
MYYKRKKNRSQSLILSVLEDGDWHRYNEIVKESGLSSATVSKYLKIMENAIIEKQIDIKSGKYPYPVSYRTLYKSINLSRGEKENYFEKLSRTLIDTKQITTLLHFMSFELLGSFVRLLKTYYENPHTRDQAILNEIIEIFVIDEFRDYFNIVKNKLDVKENKSIDVVKLLEDSLITFENDIRKNINLPRKQ